MPKAKKTKERPAAPPVGFVRFRSEDPFYEFVARLGDGSPVPTFDTGWEREKRPKKKSLTNWTGSDGLELEFPILFDHFISGDGITCEAEIRQLEKMAGNEQDEDEPPIIAFNSNGVIPHDEHDAAQVDWVIAKLQWGDSDRNKTGNRIRQAVTVTLWEYVEDTQLNDDSAATKNRKKKGPKNKKGTKNRGARHKTHHVQPGETLSTIARDELGDASRWREIAKKNPKHGRPRRDPKSVTLGETLKMP
jgi:LysM repeat protein